jgi:hypothetical protein
VCVCVCVCTAEKHGGGRRRGGETKGGERRSVGPGDERRRRADKVWTGGGATLPPLVAFSPPDAFPLPAAAPAVKNIAHLVRTFRGGLRGRRKRRRKRRRRLRRKRRRRLILTKGYNLGSRGRSGHGRAPSWEKGECRGWEHTGGYTIGGYTRGGALGANAAANAMGGRKKASCMGGWGGVGGGRRRTTCLSFGRRFVLRGAESSSTHATRAHRLLPDPLSPISSFLCLLFSWSLPAPWEAREARKASLFPAVAPVAPLPHLCPDHRGNGGGAENEKDADTELNTTDI